MRRTKAESATPLIGPPAPNLTRSLRRSPLLTGELPLWLVIVSALAAVGTILLGLTLLSVAGMLGISSSLNNPPSAQESAPVLLVVPALGSLTPAAVAPTPVSLELQTLIAEPLPTPVAANPERSVEAVPLPSPVVEVAAVAPITYRALFQEIGDAYGIDWRLLAALAFRESRMDPIAVGRDGDMGLMQILPGTWNEFAPRSIADQPFDARSNAQVAATYLLYLQDYLDQLGHGDIQWVLVAYNWGPNNVRKLLASGGDWSQVPERRRQYAADILEAAFGVRFVE
ncbi:MAG: transglycosylase SLT domain-containing protein [Caldilineaceae bacterium]|nr:transglycosylase SLT domain-containing protein [Caldilineaceae bacterium]